MHRWKRLVFWEVEISKQKDGSHEVHPGILKMNIFEPKIEVDGRCSSAVSFRHCTISWYALFSSKNQTHLKQKWGYTEISPLLCIISTYPPQFPYHHPRKKNKRKTKTPISKSPKVISNKNIFIHGPIYLPQDLKGWDFRYTSLTVKSFMNFIPPHDPSSRDGSVYLPIYAFC